MVAEGLTNRQVTRCLAVPSHTVSSHLWYALTKLNIASRVGLARLKAAREHAE
ncbi:LuxR C-terminal-related transcriptional regulator [Streptomyces sp. NPDC002265]|uniref:LuxR C-terminal-related transcriptional regulator n=1 Tax=Streptomyces sp. NPDC002265 TaxID=3154415 RepID=UPI00333469F4